MMTLDIRPKIFHVSFDTLSKTIVNFRPFDDYGFIYSYYQFDDAAFSIALKVFF